MQEDTLRLISPQKGIRKLQRFSVLIQEVLISFLGLQNIINFVTLTL
jgi:hypothetical protein